MLHKRIKTKTKVKVVIWASKVMSLVIVLLEVEDLRTIVLASK